MAARSLRAFSVLAPLPAETGWSRLPPRACRAGAAVGMHKACSDRLFAFNGNLLGRKSCSHVYIGDRAWAISVL